MLAHLHNLLRTACKDTITESRIENAWKVIRPTLIMRVFSLGRILEWLYCLCVWRLSFNISTLFMLLLIQFEWWTLAFFLWEGGMMSSDMCISFIWRWVSSLVANLCIFSSYHVSFNWNIIDLNIFVSMDKCILSEETR